MNFSYIPSLLNMKTSTSLVTAALVAYTSAHGMVRSIQGANGVEMPGLTGKFTQKHSSHLCGVDAMEMQLYG